MRDEKEKRKKLKYNIYHLLPTYQQQQLVQLGKIGKRNTYRRGSLDAETGGERRERESGPRPKAGGNKHHSQNVNVLVAGAVIGDRLALLEKTFTGT